MSDEKKIDTGGSVYITGSVAVSGGDFVGRDKVTVANPSADEGRLDTPLGDKVNLKAESDELQAKAPKSDEGFVARRVRNIRRAALTFWEWCKRP